VLCCRINESPVLVELREVMRAFKKGATQAKLLQLQQSVHSALLNTEDNERTK
jgi:hypothetical protein